MARIRILIYGDVDLNIIDGSAIWLSSLAHTLSINKSNKVFVLLKARPDREYLLNDLLNNKEIQIVNPYEKYPNRKFEANTRLSVNDASSIIRQLDHEYKFNLIILRGFNLCDKVVHYFDNPEKLLPYITNFTHDPEKITKEETDRLRSIYDKVQVMFAQTPQMIELLKKIIQPKDDKFRLLSPMIPDYVLEEPLFENQFKSLVYVGKFAKNWYTFEMLQAFTRLNGVFLNVAGDKFHSDLDDKRAEIISILENNQNIDWVRGVSREESNELIAGSDIGISWRSGEIDNDGSVELSTKILEYGRLGKPVLVRRTRIHEELFGEDYPLFIENEDDFITKVTAALNDPEVFQKAARAAYYSSAAYTFSRAAEQLQPILDSFPSPKRNLVFAGHDLKFASLIIEYFENHSNYEVRLDQWEDHHKHDEEHSLKCIDWADVIFCEWGLGNAIWYSHHKKPYQTLIVRMHLQERTAMYYADMDIKAIDRIIAISPYIYEEFNRVMPFQRELYSMVYNIMDTASLRLPKAEGSNHNLAMIGILPSRKRLDKALNILEKLCNTDKRFKLYIKGKLPQDLEWVEKRESEMAYFNEVFERIENSSLKDHVIFETHGDIATFLQKIGYVLSTSDFESFHLGPMEGMASGAVPLILHWDGAETIYPDEYIFESEQEIVDFVLNQDDSIIGSDMLMDYPKRKFDKEVILPQIESLL
jgi:glycosyltransferase involved in cell wall biosynthesis